jgi:hypothetical protein
MKRVSTLVVTGLLFLPLSVFGQQNPQRGGAGGAGGAGGNAQRGGGGGQRGPAAPPRPTPRMPDGRVNLGAPAGEVGLWAPAGIVQLSVNPTSVNRAGPTTHLPSNIKVEDVPFQDWARALHDYREKAFESDEPHSRCKPSGGARQFITPYGVEFVEFPEQKLVYIFDIGGPHTYRTIYMDGRPHPKNLEPSYYGHSIGHWETDALVVDTVGFNEKFWIDREGEPHTDKLHVIERFSRPDFNTLQYELTVDDPGAYTATWTGGFLLRWSPNVELFEYICQDNNLSPQGMVGTAESVSRVSPIVP